VRLGPHSCSLCLPGEAEVPPAVPPTTPSPAPSKQLLLVFNHKRCGDMGPNPAASKAAGEGAGHLSCPQGRRTSHLSCIEEDFQQPLGEWRNFLPVTSLRNCALRFRPSANPSAVVWLFDCHKSITFWHVEATGLDLSSGETHEGFTLPP